MAIVAQRNGTSHPKPYQTESDDLETRSATGIAVLRVNGEVERGLLPRNRRNGGPERLGDATAGDPCRRNSCHRQQSVSAGFGDRAAEGVHTEVEINIVTTTILISSVEHKATHICEFVSLKLLK